MNTLNTDVTSLKGCMTSPTDSSCTYSASTNLNKLVDSMHKCMTNPTATDCGTDFSATTTLPKVWSVGVISFYVCPPFKVLIAMDECMTDVTDSSCSRYPSTSSVPVIGKRKFQKGIQGCGTALVLSLTKIQDIFLKNSGNQKEVLTRYRVRWGCKILGPVWPS